MSAPHRWAAYDDEVCCRLCDARPGSAAGCAPCSEALSHEIPKIPNPPQTEETTP